MTKEKKIENYKPSIITIYNKNGDILLNELSLVAINKNIIRFAGKDAEYLEDSVREPLIIGSPFCGGIVADFDVASRLMSLFLKKVKKYGFLVRPQILVCAPVDMTDVEYRALSECMYRTGAKKVSILEESFSKSVHTAHTGWNICIEITPQN